jgi:dimethylhistidine N-methyltransferase
MAGTRIVTVSARKSDSSSATLAADVRNGLSRRPRQLPPKYLYDDLGSALFEAICHLPWYRVTRAETVLLSEYGRDVAAHFTESPLVVELGPGSGDKLQRLARAFADRPERPHLHLIDISSSALAAAQRSLARLAGFTVTVERATYEQGLARLGRVRADAAPMLTLLLGSNIGNYEPDAAVTLLRQVRAAGREGDWLLVGADLVKPERELLDAYDDPLGVTAAFNKNLLQRLNTSLGADFDLAGFDHRAVWNAAHERVEMHLVSRTRQHVQIPGADLLVLFEAGESIWTESSYKYTLERLASLTAEAGFALHAQWTDPVAGFALALCQSVEQGS